MGDVYSAGRDACRYHKGSYVTDDEILSKRGEDGCEDGFEQDCLRRGLYCNCE